MTRPELERMIEAERGVTPHGQRVERGWARLREAVAAGEAPLANLPLEGSLRLVGPAVKTGLGLKVAAGSAVTLTLLTGLAVTTQQRPPLEPTAVSAPPTASIVVQTSAQPIASIDPSPTAAPAAAARSPAPAPLAVAPHPPQPLLTPNRASSARPAERTSTFEAELALIKRAKSALDSEGAAEALSLLAEHSRRFPAGVFAGEREALRALALCRSGRFAEGLALGRRFIEAHPRSPLVDRVHRECER